MKKKAKSVKAWNGYGVFVGGDLACDANGNAFVFLEERSAVYASNPGEKVLPVRVSFSANRKARVKP